MPGTFASIKRKLHPSRIAQLRNDSIERKRYTTTHPHTIIHICAVQTRLCACVCVRVCVCVSKCVCVCARVGTCTDVL